MIKNNIQETISYGAPRCSSWHSTLESIFFISFDKLHTHILDDFGDPYAAEYYTYHDVHNYEDRYKCYNGYILRTDQSYTDYTYDGENISFDIETKMIDLDIWYMYFLEQYNKNIIYDANSIIHINDHGYRVRDKVMDINNIKNEMHDKLQEILEILIYI